MRLRDLPAQLNAFLLSEAIRGVISPLCLWSNLRRTLEQQKLYRKSGVFNGSFYLSVGDIGEITKEPRAVVPLCTDLGDMAGKPEAVSLEQEIVSKKGKIPSREVNETHLKVTRPRNN